MFGIPEKKLSELLESKPQIIELLKRGIFTDEATGKEYFTGYSYRRLYDWDQYFEGIAQLYAGWDSKWLTNGIEIFLDHQLDNGFIQRSVTASGSQALEHVKPFLCQNAVLAHKAGMGIDWLTDIYLDKLQKYLDYWLVDMDSTGTGLSEWMSAPHTGLDNQHERAGYWDDRISKGVDLNSYLVRECRAFAILAELKGQDDLARVYRAKAEERAEKVRDLMWDDETGFFYDLNTLACKSWQEGNIETPEISICKGMWVSATINKRIKNEVTSQLNKGKAPFHLMKAISGFMPLFAGIATPEQAERLVYEHLLDRKEFWSEFPVAVMARSEPWYSQKLLPADLGCSWRANTWMPTNYMVFHGLKNYGYTDIATHLAKETTRLLETSGDREYYNSETGEGCGLDPFWGWSLLGYFFELEDQFDADPTQL